jgi:hypothetical protein
MKLIIKYIKRIFTKRKDSSSPFAEAIAEGIKDALKEMW